ncbi:MAG TPA: FAD-dependent oxidoreductase [Candidatus Eisenbacteria bacterium]|jgi:glycine/D-amino acid oxidase-like deaminating enzyme
MSDATPKPPSYWWTAEPPEFPALDADLDVDAVIIGGGVTGLTLAYTMSEQGSVVAVLEAGRLAGEASGRNAGFLLAIPAEPYAERIALWGRDGARAFLQVSRRTHQRIAHLAQALRIDCDYRLTGSLRLTRSEEESEDLRGSLPELRHDGFPMREIALEDVLPPYARSRFHAAFEVPEDGVVHPVRFLHGLAAEAVKRRAHLHERTRVSGARWQDGLWHTFANGHVVRGRTLVIATNAYAPQLVPALKPLIMPRRGQMLATAPLETRLDPRPVYANYGYQYWRQMPDGRLVMGGWRNTAFDAESVYDTNVTPGIQQSIEQGLLELVPAGIPVEYRWAGTMGFARDGRPLVGWLDAAHHLAIAAGFTGHGMGMATACTEDLAELLAFKRAPAITSFDPQRFPEVREARDALVALGAVTG